MSIPYLKGKHLMVQDQPFLMLAGEVHNSNSSSVPYMEGVWDKAEQLGMNCLLLPITWEILEPEEGKFDFTLVDGLIGQARRRGKKLGFLWFGAWKNAQCYYAPAWVKRDQQRFKRAEAKKGQPFAYLENFHGMGYSSLSYLCRETLEADKRAFCALMQHLREVDGHENTVVLMQVENETGIMGPAREQSDAADAAFAQSVPQGFADYMKAHTETMVPDVRSAVEAGAASGTWEEVFGTVAEEIFSAYHIASYVGEIAAAGKAVYPLPMNANCWLDKGEAAGVYPSGGPVSRVHEVWHCCAPAIDILSPDIYVPNFCEICDEYTRRGGPLFIPECATHSYAGPRLVYTIGHYHAGCYAPFGFEEMGGEFGLESGFLFGMDVTDPMLQKPQNVEEYGWYARTLESMTRLLTANYGTNRLQAVCSERKGEDTLIFGQFGFKALMDAPFISRKDGVCLACQVAPDEFYVIANGCFLAPFSLDPGKPYVDILTLEEGEFVQGVWQPGRRLNGDEVAMMNYDKPTLLHIKLLGY